MDNETKFILSNDREDGLGRMQAKLMFKQYNKAAELDLNDWRKKFIEALDPTEYLGAIELVGDWEIWLQLKRNWPSFQRLYVNKWLEEIEVKMKALSIRALILQAQSPMGSSSAKFIAEGKYLEKKVGRPTKELIERNLRVSTAIEKEIANDLERVKDYK